MSRGGREAEALAGSPDDASTFWQRVKTNLHAGRIRMRFGADEIPSELRRIRVLQGHEEAFLQRFDGYLDEIRAASEGSPP